MSGCTTRSKKAQEAQQPENQLRAKWTASLTKALVELMVEEIHKGNKSSKSFSKKGWKFICDNFRIQTGYWWDNEQLKSRYVALRKQYISVALLLDQPDFQWDEATGAIMASNEAWDAYIKAHPDAEMLRSTGCSIYNHLRTIFAEPDTNGAQNGSATDDQGISISPEHAAVKEEELSPSESDKYVDMASRKRGRRGLEDAIARGILEMAGAAKLRAEAVKTFHSKFSITDCVKALDELQGVSEQVYLAALDLFINRNARETFLTLKVDKRLIWLQRKCLICSLPKKFAR
ncbi:L10-interacting MYB domain-containing protein-like [Salvia divinorum]|uniref:L10-interacting MYB domain-containing protein-like n=1 Tax=Salvia divinorum TaxID=28513 RepID=A0ABD1IPJ2_SALDI